MLATALSPGPERDGSFAMLLIWVLCLAALPPRCTARLGSRRPSGRKTRLDSCAGTCPQTADYGEVGCVELFTAACRFGFPILSVASTLKSLKSE